MPSRRDRLIMLALFFVSQGAYILTLDRHLPPLDSADFVAAAAGNGAAHPPGYPLLTVLGSLMQLVPWGTAYARYNLLSSVMGSVTVALISWCCRVIGMSEMASAFAALVLAFSTLFWKYSIIIEVFTLNGVLSAGALILTALYLKERRGRWLFGLFFVAGLGTCHLHTLVFLLIPLFAVVLYSGRRQISPRVALKCSLFYLLGLVPYLYLIAVAAADRSTLVYDLSSLGRIVHFILRRDYGTLSLSPYAVGNRWANFFGQMSVAGRILFLNFTVAGLVLVFVGVYRGVTGSRQTRLLTVALLTFLLCLFPLFLFLANAPALPLFNHVLEKQYGGVFVAMAIFMGLGYSLVEERLSGVRSTRGRSLALALWILPIVLVVRNFPLNDRRGDIYTESFAKTVMRSVEPNSIVISCYDTVLFGVRAVQAAELFQSDVVSLSMNPAPGESRKIRERLAMRSEADGNALIREILAEFGGPAGRPVYFTFGGFCQGQDRLGDIRKHLAPAGLVYRYLETPRSDEWAAQFKKGAQALASWPEVFETPPPFVATDYGTQEVISWVQDAYRNLGYSLSVLNQKDKVALFDGLANRLMPFTPLVNGREEQAP